MRPCQLRSTGHSETGVSPADGAAYRQTPESHNSSTTAAQWLSRPAENGRGVFPPLPAIYRALDRGRQGRSRGRSSLGATTVDLCLTLFTTNGSSNWPATCPVLAV